MTTASAKLAGGPGERPARSRPFFLRWPFLLVAFVLAVRCFAFAPFTIPSESMLPVLVKGDYLVAAKWPYGYSRWSLPFGAPLISGTIAPKLPARGDIAIFRHPVGEDDYIKRVIGLPGDTVAMRGGRLWLNGRWLPRQRMADFMLPVSPNTDCAWGARREAGTGGAAVCRYTRYAETLPSGRRYAILDFGRTPQDDFGPITVPDGTVFLLGDNRDNSQDSRFPASPSGGIGLVPQDRLLARASRVLLSFDGSAVWYAPWTWFSAIRWSRAGEEL